jgi:hypothetical protein
LVVLVAMLVVQETLESKVLVEILDSLERVVLVAMLVVQETLESKVLVEILGSLERVAQVVLLVELVAQVVLAAAALIQMDLLVLGESVDQVEAVEMLETMG